MEKWQQNICKLPLNKYFKAVLEISRAAFVFYNEKTNLYNMVTYSYGKHRAKLGAKSEF